MSQASIGADVDGISGDSEKVGAVLSPNSVTDEGAVAVASVSIALDRPRASILKRKLPLMRNSTTVLMSSSPSYAADDDATTGSGATTTMFAATASSRATHPRDSAEGRHDDDGSDPMALLALAQASAARVGMSAEEGEEKKEEDGCDGEPRREHNSRAEASSSLPMATNMTPV
jgi:hypothetical protein